MAESVQAKSETTKCEESINVRGGQIKNKQQFSEKTSKEWILHAADRKNRPICLKCH